MRDSSLSALRSSAPGWLLATLHFALGMRLIADPRVMHDEGQAMFGFSRSLSESFFACFFFQKVKPALALFHAVPARLGFVPYLVFHLAVCSFAVWLLFRVAQSMGQRRPWVPALVLALSPIYAWCSATGIANADGVAATGLFLYLLEYRRSPFWAGFVLGTLPWIRFELVVFSAVFAVFTVVRHRDRRFVAGLVAWPMLYAALGAIYHHDPLWLVRLKPASATLQAWNGPEARIFASHTAATAIESFLCVSPALMMLPFTRRLRALERALLSFTLLFSLLYLATHFRPLPIGPLFVVGFVMRHAGLPIVAVALLAGRALERIEDDDARAPIAVLVVWIAFGVYARAVGAGPIVLAAACALALVVACARAHRPRVAAAAFAGLIVAGPLLVQRPMTREGFSREAMVSQRSVDDMTAALEAIEPSQRVVVYTNNHTLHPFLERTGRLPGLRVVFILANDMTYEMTAQTNPNNGQRQAVLRAIPRATFGEAVAIQDFKPERVPMGALIALVDDARNDQILPSDIWSPHLRALPSPRGMQIAIVK